MIVDGPALEAVDPGLSISLDPFDVRTAVGRNSGTMNRRRGLTANLRLQVADPDVGKGYAAVVVVESGTGYLTR